MTPNVLLIDALNVIRRVHGAIPDADENRQVNQALEATQHSIERALKECNPTHALAVFDGHATTWRHTLLPNYKAGRKPMPEPLRLRLKEFAALFNNMSIRLYRKTGLEADDVIGAVAHKVAQVQLPVTILSTDKIYRQLLSHPTITLRDHFKKTEMRATEVLTETGFAPEQLLDYWALAGLGDIPGVEGIGHKGAMALMTQYGSLSNMLVALTDADSRPLKKLAEQVPTALLMRELVTLRTDLALGLNVKALRLATTPLARHTSA